MYCMCIFVPACMFIKNSWAYLQENTLSEYPLGICRTQWLIDTGGKGIFFHGVPFNVNLFGIK